MRSSNHVIEVENLIKDFPHWTDQPTTLKTFLIRISKGQFRTPSRGTYRVLDNLTFQVPRGQFLGIMGRNGAGKSTLFKLLAGIYKPTSGQITVKEPLAPLIELGAGFHEEFTGYENIFLNAAILGFNRQQTLSAVDSIIEFSELGEKIHMPVKHYSSGMYVRLGFAVATHLPSPILLVDEVLAVGDIAFQEKCLAKIESLHKEGRTIILITHSPETVTKHCERCLVIEKQRVLFDGDARLGAEFYVKTMHT